MSRTATTNRSGPGYALAEFLRATWTRVGLTNEEAARELGLNAAGVVSQWKAGKSRVPIERLPALARIMKLDLSALLPLWLEQYAPGTPRSKLSPESFAEIEAVLGRIATRREWQAMKAIRDGLASRARRFTNEQLEAYHLLAARPELADAVRAQHATESAKCD